MHTTIIRGATLSLGLVATANAWAHGDPATHFHASHGAGTLAGAVFVGALATGALVLLARAVTAWRRQRRAAARTAP
jgi:hypothetical protein